MPSRIPELFALGVEAIEDGRYDLAYDTLVALAERLRVNPSPFVNRGGERLPEWDFKPTTVACLHNAGIYTTWRLLEHTCRELIWHSEIPAAELYNILCVLSEHRVALKPITNRDVRPLSERDLEMFRLRVVEGRSLSEVGEEVGVSVERIRQLLSLRFGLHGEPLAVKLRPRQNRGRRAAPGCAQVGRAIHQLRTAKGLTAEALASAADVNAEQLARIEDGLRDPTWTTFARLAVALDTTPALLSRAVEVEKP